MKNTAQSTQSLPIDMAAAVEHIRHTCADSLDILAMTISHPRSLARDTAAWRPPTLRMPSICGLSPLNITVTRRRVGHQATERISSYGEQRNAAYMVMMRLTAADGRTPTVTEAESWMRAFLPAQGEYSVHRLDGLGAPTYCWVVDAHYTPITTPASLFQPHRTAA